jgi:prepilin-type N-terminal cleavage/methylation domain-containing protein
MKVRDERGFTLVELLIVIAIIAILAAIAIPQFAAHTARAVEASMVADARNAATVLYTLHADARTYEGAIGGTGTVTFTVGGVTYTIMLSPGNTLAIVSDVNTFTITITNPNARAGRTTHTLNHLGEVGWS